MAAVLTTRTTDQCSIPGEPGWWFSGTMAGSVTVLAGAVAILARREGHAGVFFGPTALVAPPLGLAVAVAAPRKVRGVPG